MNCELSVLEGGDIAIFRINSCKSFEKRRMNLEDIVKFCREKDIQNVIVDGRKQHSFSSMIEMYEYGSTLPKIAPDFNWAVVRSQDDDDLQFVNDVASNRGASIRSFLSIKEAQQWLETLENPKI